MRYFRPSRARMPGPRAVALLVGLLAVWPRPGAGQQLAARQRPDSTRPAAATSRLGFSGAAEAASSSLTERLRLDPEPEAPRLRSAVIGGAIGAATGVITCTVISNLVKDSDDGLTTCDTKAYLAFAGGGFALGAVVGWLIR